MTKQELIDYLKKVVELEKSCYEQDSILKNLDAESENIRNSIVYNEKPPKPLLEPDYLVFLLVSSLLVLLIFMMFIITGTENFFSGDNYKSIIGTIIVVSCLIGGISNSILSKLKYRKLLISYKQEVHNINLLNEKIDVESDTKQQHLKSESDEIQKSLSDTRQVLNEYYDLNIIYPKYRDMASVSNILEYLLSGRCDDLTGRDGAYNLLEDDIKFGIIVNKFDDIIGSLEVIKRNQHYLFTAISEANISIQNLSERIIESSYRMEAKLASIEYTNSINARNTQYLSSKAFWDSF